MAARTQGFGLDFAKLEKNWITGGRNVCSIWGAQRVAFGGVGTKDGGKGRIRLFWAASADPSGSSSQPSKPSPNSRRKGEGPSKSDLKLVKDLKEFISVNELPLTEVPTTKELIRNGRQDLANAVRRRGYKTVACLLGFSPGTEALAKDIGADSAARDISENGMAGNSSTDSPQMYNIGEEETQGLAVSAGKGDSRSSSPGCKEKNANSNGFIYYSENALRESSASTPMLVPEVLSRDSQLKEFVGQTSLSEGRDYLQHQLDLIKDASQTFDPLQTFSTGRDGGDNGFVEDGEESDSEYTDDDYEDDDEDEEDNDTSEDVPAARTVSSFESHEDVAAKKAALLRSRILEYFDSRKDDKMKTETSQDGMLSKRVALEQEDIFLEKDMELANNQKLEAAKELERIKKLLHQRELVLAEVAKELEEAKAQFSLARAKATAELVHATQLAAEREARLQAAEKTLSSLRQVHLEWWGEAKHVELAGTFNGWQHRILMEPDPSSEIPKPDGSRGSMMWGTHLRLYPGVYEIKFIVDGNWQLDHKREVVMRHGNQNNVLRVEF